MARMLGLASGLVLLAAAAPAHGATLRITDGTPATIEQAPYMAALFDRTKPARPFECGGAVIAPRAILTAAHCVDSFRAEWLQGRVGSGDLENGGTLVRVSRIRLHRTTTCGPTSTTSRCSSSHSPSPFPRSRSRAPTSHRSSREGGRRACSAGAPSAGWG